MKTIFIPAYDRHEVKTLFVGSVFDRLRTLKNTRLVIFVPDYRLNEYQKEFPYTNVVFEGVPALQPKHSLLNSFFEKLSRSYLDIPSNRLFRKKWLLMQHKKPIQYVLSMSLLIMFGNIKPLRVFVRFLDIYCVRDTRFKNIFNTYHPDLVFVPNIETTLGQSLIRHAKKRRITTVGMVKSWESVAFPRTSLRLLPDTVIVQNSVIQRLMTKYFGLLLSHIYVCGAPILDLYRDAPRTPREKFCEQFGIDPTERIILFASVAARNPTEYQVLKTLDDAIKKDTLPNNIVFLVRNHPSGDMVKGTLIQGDLKPSEKIFFDNAKTFLPKGKTYVNGLKDDAYHLADSLLYSDVVITTASSISADAAFFKKPIINLGFDGEEKKDFSESVARYYTPLHPHSLSLGDMQPKTAYSFDELVTYIKNYLENPNLDKEKQEHIAEEQCYKRDGQSSKRVVDIIVSVLSRT